MGVAFFSPLRDTNSKTTHYLLSHSFVFQLNTLKGNTKALTLDLLRLNTLRGSKTVLLTTRWYNEYPHPFYIEVPPPPPTWKIRQKYCVTYTTYTALQTLDYYFICSNELMKAISPFKSASCVTELILHI